MAVDQAKYMNFFPSNNNMLNINNNNQFYEQNNNFIPQMTPLYNLNDVVYHQISGKTVTPAVKADSGITFNNSLIPPQPSRKRPRGETISCVTPQIFTLNNPMCNTPHQTVTTRTTSSVNLFEKDINSATFSFLGQDLSLQIMQQQLEFDRLISHHNERMKIEIEERKKQQFRTIMAAMEESIGRRLREKEEELTKLGRINFALEEKLKSLCLENQIWRDLAQTNEATANTLRTNLEQVLEQMKDNADRNNEVAVADDANSCCGSSGDAYDALEVENEGQSGWIYRGKSGGNGKNNENNNGRLCKKCGEGERSVLLLPCRHLCLCATCGPKANSCPICDTVKTASVHVNLSS